MSKSSSKTKKLPAVKARKESGASSVPKPAAAPPADLAKTEEKRPMAVSTDSAFRAKFECQQPNAQSVYLAASFNNWDPSSTHLLRGNDGCWKVEVNLAPGTYEYQFVVDGVWMEDPKAHRQVPNPFGTLNSVIEIHREQPRG